MALALYVLAILSFLGGMLIFSAAKSAVHEIEAFLLWVLTAILLSGAAIVGNLKVLIREVKSSARTSFGSASGGNVGVEAASRPGPKRQDFALPPLPDSQPPRRPEGRAN